MIGLVAEIIVEQRQSLFQGRMAHFNHKPLLGEQEEDGEDGEDEEDEREEKEKIHHA